MAQEIEVSPKDMERWQKELALWDLEQISEFFEDEETGQLGAMCIGRSIGAVSYFRAL